MNALRDSIKWKIKMLTKVKMITLISINYKQLLKVLLISRMIGQSIELLITNMLLDNLRSKEELVEERRKL